MTGKDLMIAIIATKAFYGDIDFREKYIDIDIDGLNPGKLDAKDLAWLNDNGWIWDEITWRYWL